MIPTPHQPKKHYGIGGVNYHTGETVVIFRRRKRRPQIAEFLQHLLDAHPQETIYVTWDNVNTHQDDEVEAIQASKDFFDRFNQKPEQVLSIIGANPA